jgi:pepF/M3 family oligoendopeptidase
MTVIYPELLSPEVQKGFERVVGIIASLAETFERYRIGKRGGLTIDDETVRDFDDVTRQINATFDEVQTFAVYLMSFIATDSRNDLAQAKDSELDQHMTLLDQLDTRYTAWLGSLDVEALIERSAIARDHAFALRKAKVEAAHLMSPEEESLAAELNVSAGSAWAKLHQNISSQLAVPIEQDGVPTELPMSAIRNLAYDPDRETRKRAYEAELAAWQRVDVPLAAALNSIKGEVNTLSARRGWGTPLDAALFQNNIDRETLDAMMQAARESFPDFRRYWHTKARALGLDRLAWFDLFAPVGQSTRTWEWDEARDFIIKGFSDYSPKLGDFAARAFHENWIDAEPRPGKRDGAFCTSLRGDESRILANFKPAFAGLSTLAHELGHAYHNLNKANRTAIQRTTPMALAETASTFCETLIRDAALRQSDVGEQLAILDASLEGSSQIVVDITSRFLFEQRVFERRNERELSVDELKALMLEAQQETYGDGLDPTLLHPYMWAVKGHYYSTGRSYYNYPYMFGQLFALGLYAQYWQDPDTFRASYDDLLSSTGLADAATLAARFGIDIRTPAFWRASLDIIREDIARFDELVGRV